MKGLLNEDELLVKLEHPQSMAAEENKLFAIGAVLFVGLDVASLSAIGAFACSTSCLLNGRDGSR